MIFVVRFTKIAFKLKANYDKKQTKNAFYVPFTTKKEYQRGKSYDTRQIKIM
jgi:hypothetical protein